MTITTDTSTPITLDAIHKAMNHWRANKHKYKEPGIPNTIWQMLFDFEDAGNSGQELRRMFGLNSGQYKKKRQELCELEASPEVKATAEAVDFCEAVIEPFTPESVPALTDKAAATKKTIRQLKSTHTPPESYLKTTTIIVECISPDGHRLVLPHLKIEPLTNHCLT